MDESTVFLIAFSIEKLIAMERILKGLHNMMRFILMNRTEVHRANEFEGVQQKSDIVNKNQRWSLRDQIVGEVVRLLCNECHKIF